MLGLIKLTQFNILTSLQNVVSNAFVSILVFALIGGIVISSFDFKKSYLSNIFKF
jgi:hypothetical protein